MQELEPTIHISIGSIIKVIVVVLIFLLLFMLKSLVLVLLMSIVIASAIEPWAQWFIRRGVPRLLSVILIYLSVIVCIVGIVFFLLLPLLSESSDFLRNFPIYFNASTILSNINNNEFLSSQSIVSGLTNSIGIEQVIAEINSVISS